MATTKPITEYSELYNQYSKRNDYQKVPLLEDEWAILDDQSEIESYLPKPNTTTVSTGITNIQTKTLDNFDSIDISKCIPKKRAHIINAGGSIWGLDFVPKPSSSNSSDQYLAIGGYNTTTEHHLLWEEADMDNRLNAIQIWKLVDFKWCPFSVYDTKKLGILAVMFSNGIIRLFVVPHPQSMRKKGKSSQRDTVYSKMHTLVRIVKELG
ncbi:hypothetical protein PS6_011365 [Mucor atramentarius]